MPRHTGPVPSRTARAVRVDAGGALLHGDLVVPSPAYGAVLFAHGSGSGRFSPRHRHVAEALNRRGLATLLMDLLSPEEERLDAITAELRFDVGLLAHRLLSAADQLSAEPLLAGQPLGFFGASTGAAAALIAAAQRPELVGAVVTRGGRTDLAGPALDRVRAPTLLIVGGRDYPVIDINEEALDRLERIASRLEVVPGATHLFAEPGTLNVVAELTGDWFERYLPRFQAGLAAPGEARRDPPAPPPLR